MNILLIGSKQTSGNIPKYYNDYIDFFRKGSLHAKSSVGFSWTLFDDLFISVGDGDFRIIDTKSGHLLEHFDLILIRGKAFRHFFDVVRSVSRYAELKNIPVVNNYSGFRDSSKLAQAVQFFETGLPVANTVYVSKAVLEDKNELPFGFPCIMKAVFGAHGNDNYLVKSMDEVRNISEKSDLRFVLQRFVPNDNDFRILIMGSDAITISRKAINGSHLNNTSMGGEAYLVANESLPKGLIQDSIKIARYLDMTIAGVDALIDKETGEYFFLEVNSQPQLMSGAFIEEKEKLFGRYLDSTGL